MLRLRDGIVELYRKAATSIPPDVEEALKSAHASEQSPPAKETAAKILEDIRSSRRAGKSVCEDTGVPTFFVKAPRGLSHGELRKAIREATEIATEKVPLSPNAVDILTGENSGKNTGIGFPIIHFEEALDDTLRIDLMLKGAECENLGRTYMLPAEGLGAGAHLEGVGKCVIDAVKKAGGKGCPPYTLGVGIGGAKDQVALLAKEQLLRKIPDCSEYPALAGLEQGLLEEINRLGIGPLGLGGATTAIGVKIGVNHRHPASYLVEISFSCWANRRVRLLW